MTEQPACKRQLLHLPKHFGRILPIMWVGVGYHSMYRNYPSEEDVYDGEAPRPPRKRHLLHLPEHFGSILDIKWVDVRYPRLYRDLFSHGQHNTNNEYLGTHKHCAD